VTAGSVHAPAQAQATVPATQLQIGGNALIGTNPNNSGHLTTVFA
jgi:hypothetical protein